MKKIVLGDEYDDQLRELLIQALKDMGAKPVDTDWAVAGSQELETMRVELAGKPLVIEAETYIGLSVSGDDAQVDQLARRLAKPR